MVALLDSATASSEERLNACAHLIQFGRIGAAAKHLVDLAEVPAFRSRVEWMLARCRELRSLDVETDTYAKPKPRTTGRADRPVEDQGYWCVPARSDTTLIAFTGAWKRLDISIYFMQRILRPHRVNAIYVFDWEDAYYFGGVRGLGHNIADTVAGLWRMCAELNTKRLICLGQSSGGYAALRYGIDLRADGVLAFSPVILPVLSGRIFARISEILGAEPNPDSLDLRTLFAARRRTPFTEIVYGDRNLADVRSSAHMAGLPGLILHPLPEVESHGTVEALTMSGEFSPLFARFCELVGPGRWQERSQSQRVRR